MRDQLVVGEDKDKIGWNLRTKSQPLQHLAGFLTNRLQIEAVIKYFLLVVLTLMWFTCPCYLIICMVLGSLPCIIPPWNFLHFGPFYFILVLSWLLIFCIFFWGNDMIIIEIIHWCCWWCTIEDEILEKLCLEVFEISNSCVCN